MNNFRFIEQLRELNPDEFNFHIKHLDDDWLGSYINAPYSELGKLCEVWGEGYERAVKGFYVGRHSANSEYAMFLAEDGEVFSAHISFAYVCQPEISVVDALKYHAEKQS